MAVDLRSEIFSRKAAGESHARIAATLGISKSKVQRELTKTATQVAADTPGGNGAGTVIVPPAPVGMTAVAVEQHLALDPDVIAARKQLELDRAELARKDVQLRAMELDHRLKLMQTPNGADGGNQVVALLLAEVSRQREALQAVLERQSQQPSGVDSLTGQLAQWREIGSLVQSFTPPRPPSTRDELDLTVALEGLKTERQRLDRKLEADLEDQREARRAEGVRAEAIAKAIEQATPLLVAAADRWLTKPAETPAPARPGLNGAATTLEGLCPRCGRPVRLTPDGSEDRCPACGVGLAAADGQIVLRALRPQVVDTITH